MIALITSDLFRRISGGFAVGAVAMFALQTPENAAAMIDALRGALLA